MFENIPKTRFSFSADDNKLFFSYLTQRNNWFSFGFSELHVLINASTLLNLSPHVTIHIFVWNIFWELHKAANVRNNSFEAYHKILLTFCHKTEMFIAENVIANFISELSATRLLDRKFIIWKCKAIKFSNSLFFKRWKFNRNFSYLSTSMLYSPLGKKCSC